MSSVSSKSETYSLAEFSITIYDQFIPDIIVISDSDEEDSPELPIMTSPLQRAAVANMSASAQEILGWSNETNNRNNDNSNTRTPHPSPAAGASAAKNPGSTKAHPRSEIPASPRPAKMRKSFRSTDEFVFTTAAPRPVVSTASTATVGNGGVGRIDGLPTIDTATADDPFWPQDRIKSLTSMYKSELDENIVLRDKLETAQRRVAELEAAKNKSDKEIADMNKYRDIIAHIKKSVDNV